MILSPHPLLPFARGDVPRYGGEQRGWGKSPVAPFTEGGGNPSSFEIVRKKILKESPKGEGFAPKDGY